MISQHNLFQGSDCLNLSFFLQKVQIAVKPFYNSHLGDRGKWPGWREAVSGDSTVNDSSRKKKLSLFIFFFHFQFYAFYKQTKEGECSESEPGFWDVVRKAKW